MKVYIFNPENDMALADGNPGYTPPAIIRQMRDELYWLPNWWAEEGDIVWNGTDRLQLKQGDEICPWGWSPALVHQLRHVGVTDEFLPSDGELERIRWLSHRQTAVEALSACKQDGLIGEALMGESYLCKTEQEVKEILTSAKDGESFLFKAPWSSSGRGLMLSSSSNAKGWIKNTLKAQGSVVVERLLHKVTDFALEFWCDGKGGVEYCGLSLFYTNDSGAYLGNWVAPEGQKVQWLIQYVNPQLLVEIRHWWETYLQQFQYRGPVGVDMMLCQGGICPCIEINWRMTMGYISTLLPAQGKSGRMVVEYIYGHYSAEVEAFS